MNYEELEHACHDIVNSQLWEGNSNLKEQWYVRYEIMREWWLIEFSYVTTHKDYKRM